MHNLLENKKWENKQKWHLEDHRSSFFLSQTFIIGQNLNLYHLTAVQKNRNIVELLLLAVSSYYCREGRQRFRTFCLFIPISSTSQSQCEFNMHEMCQILQGIEVSLLLRCVIVQYALQRFWLCWCCCRFTIALFYELNYPYHVR